MPANRSPVIPELPPFVLPLLGAVIASGLIGLERDWRGRAAGFRTHLMVGLAAALLMQAAVSQGDWAIRALPEQTISTDPTRLAHGMLTGIGFLCAGVIFRSGFSIHGLTTAASLWITSAIGLLFGTGLYALGITGTAITLGILTGLRLLKRWLPGQTVVDVTVAWLRSSASPRDAVREALARVDARLKPGSHELNADGKVRQQVFRLRVTGVDLDALADEIAAIPGVCGFSIDPRDD